MASICLLVFRWVIAVPHGCAYPPVATRSFRPTPRRTRPPPRPLQRATPLALAGRRVVVVLPVDEDAVLDLHEALGPASPDPYWCRPGPGADGSPHHGIHGPCPTQAHLIPFSPGGWSPAPQGLSLFPLPSPIPPPPTRQSVRSLLTPVARHLCGANPGGGWHLVDTVSGGPGAWGHVWGSARSLADELLRTPDVVRGQRVLDLGCARGPGGGVLPPSALARGCSGPVAPGTPTDKPDCFSSYIFNLLIPTSRSATDIYSRFWPWFRRT